MYRQADNKVRIEGILSETDLRYGSYEKNGQTIETIGGTIKVQVDQEINGVPTTLEVPVHMFSNKYTKAGKVNPAYESIEKVMKEFVSIAAAGSIANADRIRITNGDIKMNEFLGQNNQIVSQPRIHASFVSKAIGDFRPEATFNLEFMVGSIAREVDNDGVEKDPPRLNVKAYVPQYTSENASVMNVDTVPLVAIAPGVINAIEEYWVAGESFRCGGRLNFSSKTEEVLEESGFGEPQRRVHTVNVSEFIITGGSEVALDENLAFSVDDVKNGIVAKREKIMESKNVASKKTPSPAEKSSKGVLDLGF